MRCSPQNRRCLALLGLGLLAATPLAAQTLTNNGGTLFVNNGGVLHVNGGLSQAGPALLRTSGTATVTGNVQSTAAATLDLSTGTLDVAGNVAHAGTTAGTTGTLRLRGTAPQTLALNNGTVPNLSVDKPGGAATLTGPVQVREVLTVANAGNLVLNGQPLTLRSDASGTALVVNASTGIVSGGTATVQRYLTTTNQGLGYRQYSSPVSGNTLSDLATAGFAPIFNLAYNTSATSGNTTPFPTVFGYDQGRLATATSSYTGFDKGWFSPAATDPMTTGVGYTVNIAGTQTEGFTGTLNTGTYTRSLARGTDAAAGFHLVGNPYAAPLDWSAVAPADRAGLDGTMYVFESSSAYGGSYRSYTNGIGSGNPLIGSSQGFFVHVSNGQPSGSLTFRNAQRKTSYADQVPMRRGAADLRPQVQLRLAGNGPSDDLYLYAEAGATTGSDAEYDALKLPNPTGLNLAALTATGEALAIQGLPAFAGTVLPLSVSVPAAGSYAFTAAAMRNLPAGTRVELVDQLTGIRTALVAGSSYRFALTGTTAPGRFYLNLSAGALATASPALEAQVLAYPNPAHGTLTVLRPAGATTSATLLNSLGQTVRTLALPTAETTLDLRGLAPGVYTLHLTLDGQPVSKRVVLD